MKQYGDIGEMHTWKAFYGTVDAGQAYFITTLNLSKHCNYPLTELIRRLM
jgi:hypothetical protein